VKPYRFHTEASKEYAQAAEYHAAILPELSVRLYEEIERLIVEVRHQPARFFRFNPPAQTGFGSQIPVFVNLSRRSGTGLDCGVMHAKRRPGYWSGCV
jgi:hypothetical protein